MFRSFLNFSASVFEKNFALKVSIKVPDTQINNINYGNLILWTLKAKKLIRLMALLLKNDSKFNLNRKKQIR